MRIIIQFGCLVSLCLVLIHAWNRQFEPAPGGHRVGLNELQPLGSTPVYLKHHAQSLTLSATAEKIRHATFSLPLGTSSAYLFFRISAQARQIIRGEEKWHDGRLFIEWMSPDNQRAAVSYLHSAQGDSSTSTHFAVKVPHKDLRPVLRIENLAKSGDYVIHEIELTPAQQTGYWKWGSPLILVGFIVVIASILAKESVLSLPRRFCAAIITCVIAYFFIVPGPWPQRKGLGRDLVWNRPVVNAGLSRLSESGTMHAAPSRQNEHSATMSHEAPTARADYAQLPEPENLALRAKKALVKIRALLHFALLFFPVWLLCYCVGKKRGFLLGLAMALSIEGAQWLFGYGFHVDDVKDLVSDLCGISLGVYLHDKLSLKIRSWLPFPFPEPSADGKSYSM